MKSAYSVEASTGNAIGGPPPAIHCLGSCVSLRNCPAMLADRGKSANSPCGLKQRQLGAQPRRPWLTSRLCCAEARRQRIAHSFADAELAWRGCGRVVTPASGSYPRLRTLLCCALALATRFLTASGASIMRLPLFPALNQPAVVTKSFVQKSLAPMATGCNVATSPGLRPGRSQRPRVYM